MRLLLALLLLVVLQVPARAGPDDLAVIIANKRYDNAHEVAYADRDGEAMRDFAERVLAIPKDRIIYVPDATFGRMRSLFGTASRPGEIAGRLAGRKAQRVWVYYSGHGIPGRAAQGGAFDPYLLPKDGSPGQPEHSAFALHELEAALRAAVMAHAKGAQTVLILDACFSGRSESVKGGEAKGAVLSPESSAGGPVRFAPRPAHEELIVLAAARDDEIASWDREAGHGLFTELLLQALFNGTGEGKRVTVGAVDAFVAARTNERLAALFPGGGREQSPEFRGRRGIVLVDNAGTLVRDQDARLQAIVQCNGLKHASDPNAIAAFLGSSLCARSCDEACRTALDGRRRALERDAAECAGLARGLDELVKAGQPKEVLEAALAGVPERCTVAQGIAQNAISALERPKMPIPAPKRVPSVLDFEQRKAEEAIAAAKAAAAAAERAKRKAEEDAKRAQDAAEVERLRLEDLRRKAAEEERQKLERDRRIIECSNRLKTSQMSSRGMIKQVNEQLRAVRRLGPEHCRLILQAENLMQQRLTIYRSDGCPDWRRYAGAERISASITNLQEQIEKGRRIYQRFCR